MCLSGESAFREMNPCPKEQQDCGKQKRKADGQQEEVFMQIALRIQIFGGKCLCNQAENAAKQDGCADIGKVTHHPVFCCVFIIKIFRTKNKAFLCCLTQYTRFGAGIRKEKC